MIKDLLRRFFMITTPCVLIACGWIIKDTFNYQTGMSVLSFGFILGGLEIYLYLIKHTRR